jgi:protein SCO1/2
MRTIIRSGLLVVLLLVASLATAPDLHAASPLPAESVYHLQLVLTDQDGHAADWRAHRGKVQVVSMFYTSCQYICPLIVDSGKAIEHQLTTAERDRIGKGVSPEIAQPFGQQEQDYGPANQKAG